MHGGPGASPRSTCALSAHAPSAGHHPPAVPPGCPRPASALRRPGWRGAAAPAPRAALPACPARSAPPGAPAAPGRGTAPFNGSWQPLSAIDTLLAWSGFNDCPPAQPLPGQSEATWKEPSQSTGDLPWLAEPGPSHLLPLRSGGLDAAVAVRAVCTLDEPRRVSQPPILDERLGLTGGTRRRKAGEAAEIRAGLKAYGWA